MLSYSLEMLFKFCINISLSRLLGWGWWFSQLDCKNLCAGFHGVFFFDPQWVHIISLSPPTADLVENKIYHLPVLFSSCDQHVLNRNLETETNNVIEAVAD